jgi:hypothetical protein
MFTDFISSLRYITFFFGVFFTKLNYSKWDGVFPFQFLSSLTFVFSNVMHQLQNKESMFSTWLHGKQFISFSQFSLISLSLPQFCIRISLNDMNFFFSAFLFCCYVCMCVCVYIRVTSARKNYIKLFQSQHIRQRFNLFYFRCSALLLHLYFFPFLSYSYPWIERVCAIINSTWLDWTYADTRKYMCVYP